MARRENTHADAVRASRMQVSIGDRLAVSSEEIVKFLPVKERTGHIVLREDLSVRYTKK